MTFRTVCRYPPNWFFNPAGASGAGAFHDDLDAAVLGPAVGRVVRGDRMCVAKPLGRQDIRIDALRAEIGDDIVGPPRGQIDVVLDARPLSSIGSYLTKCA